MAFELNPVAVTAAPLLRAVQAGGWSTMSELANLAGRHPNHMSRDLGAMERAGLITRDPLALTPAAIDQLAALDRAADASAGGELLPGEMLLTHGQMKPNPDNPRSDFESDKAVEDINDLRASVVARGLKQNLIVKPEPDPEDGLWIVTDGNRRWHGIQQAIWDGDWDEARPIRVVRDAPGELESLLTAVVSNMQREPMHPLDEARAFARLRDQFMMSTADIVRETGKQARVVQLRLKLLSLSDDDMDRMRLPSDHPDHLTYKAATLQLATPRAPTPTGGGHPSLSEQLQEFGTATLSPQREPDSPSGGVGSGDPAGSPSAAQNHAATVAAAPEKTFGERLTDREALMLVEIADKVARQPATAEGLPDYTRIQPSPPDATSNALLARSIIGLRKLGDDAFIRILSGSSGAGEWLKELGFDTHPADVLFEMRARVVGSDRAAALAGDARYATGWLNPDYQPPAAAPAPAPIRTPEPDPEQPELIETTEEERAARAAAEGERAAVARDRVVVDRLAEDAMEALAKARRERRTDWPNVTLPSPNYGLSDVADAVFAALATGDAPSAAACLAVLIHRGGAMGAMSVLRSQTIPRTEAVMTRARTDYRDRMYQPDPDFDPVADPVEDFVQAEPEDDADNAGDGPTVSRKPGEPAVPIRNSITADHIVCLEDGRKFKSLKRHLRTRYNLSPEEYRARWALPADYPMVAPNYAKARHELAMRMGLGTAESA